MKNDAKDRVTNCESCVFYDYNEEWDSYECTVNMDQDDLSAFQYRGARSCPYYRFYDEYKSVQKQN